MPESRSSLLRDAWLIAQREYLERVRSRAFLLTTVLVPLFLWAVFGGNLLTGGPNAGALRHIAVASDDPKLAASVEQALGANTLSAAVELVAPATAQDRQALNARVDARQLDGYLWIDQKQGEALPSATYVSRIEPGPATKASLESAVRDGAMRERLLSRGTSAAEVSAMLGPVTLKLEQSGKGGSEASTYLIIMLLYVIVIVYGMDVARSVIQEKTSRIFEVLLATSQPESLMLGKLLGVGAAGLTQVAAWGGLLAVASAPALAAQVGLKGFASLGVTPVQICFFVLYFVLGYLFYSGIAAGIGASLSAEQEIQQFAFVLVAPMMVSVLLMDRLLRNPDGPLAVVLSFLPPCTPIVMYLRLSAHQPPAWQLALSVVLMVAAIALVVWIAARLYRVGILMYGKRATLPELLRWMRYS
jgi:ABC-2 type transport system permease protein